MQEDPEALTGFCGLVQAQFVFAAATALPLVSRLIEPDIAILPALALALGWTLTWLVPILTGGLRGRVAGAQWAAPGLNIAFMTLLSALSGGLSQLTSLWFAAIPLSAALFGTRQLVSVSALGSGLAIALLIGLYGVGANDGSTALAFCSNLVAFAFATMAALYHQDTVSRERDDTGLAGGAEAVLCDAADAVIVFERTGQARFVSPALDRLLGIAPEALEGGALQDFLHKDDRRVWSDLVARLRCGVEDGQAELRMLHQRGRFVWMEMRARRRPDTGQIIAVLRPVEERKRAEYCMMQAREDAEAASKSKTRFLASVSHELRTPLNAIIGFSEVMREEMFGPLGNRRYHEYSDYIHESGRHLLDLINDILDMSKIEAGRYDLKVEPVCMPLVIEKCLKTIAFSAQKAGVQLRVDLPGSLPNLNADGRAMRQVLLNLLSNAVKFTPEGGEIAIAVSAGPKVMTLSVRDTGIGIPEDALERIGQPFEQAHQPVGFDGAPAESGQPLGAGMPGTGLGLAIVRALVALHDGVMTIDSREGEGTCVSVTLPLRRGAADATDEAGPRQAGRARLRPTAAA